MEDCATQHEIQLKPLPLNETTDTSAMSAAPNPKPSAVDKRGYGRLASLYTAFSTEFARFALEHCVSEGYRTIVDPFTGMGTIGEAGRGMPIQLLLNDLNPFASLSSLFRTASSNAIAESIERIRSISVCDAPSPEKEAFASIMREKIGGVATLAELINSEESSKFLSALLDVHLIALIRISTHKRLRGSNPTWTKRSSDQLIDSTSFAEARDAVLAAASNYASKLDHTHDDFSATSRCQDIKNLRISEGWADAIITSPPYPNRTDYIRHYLPAAELLIGGDEDVERHLRETQIGTPLIRGALPSTALPKSVEDIIDRVRNHDSYASERYYAKGFRYYFADMKTTFSQFQKWLRPGGIAIVVVQDTYYKEMRIPVGDLVSDVAKMEGLTLEGRKDFPVRQALSRLSATARAATPIRATVESALLLKRQ